MAEEKKNELIFSLYDNMTNELICSGNASIYIIKDGKKIVIANKKLTIFPTKVEIEKEYLREKLYIELLDNPTYNPYPFPDPYIATIPICFCRQSLIQSVRFIPKGTYIGIVKAYGSEMGILNSKEEVYLSNWKDETISIAKDQTITLKAFLFYNVEKGKKKSSNRFFLNNDDIENTYSENIYWAFTIVDNIAGFSSSDESNSLRRDIDDNGNGMYLYLHEEGEVTKTIQQKNNTEIIQNLETLNKELDYNSLQQFKIYKLMKSGKDITGHTINFKLSDVLSEELLNDSNFLDRFCIIFFAYTLEDKPQYYDNSDNVQSIELKIVANKYSMVFDGYHLELYTNGKYIKNFEAKLMLEGKEIGRDSFPFMPLSEQKYIGLDDLYTCKPSVLNKINYITNQVNYITDQVTDIAHKIMDSFKNNKISDNATTNNTTNNNLNNANYNQDDDSLITHYIRTYMNMLSLSEPQYSIISNDNTENDSSKKNDSTKKNTDTGSNTKISINYIIDEKILRDKDIILQNLHKKSSSNNNIYTKMKNNMIKLNNSILLSSNNFKSLISMLNSQSDILVKFIYQPEYVIEVTRYKEVYNNKTISHMLGRYGATYGVFAVYVYYMGEKFLLDSVIEAYNEAKKLNNNIKLTNDNIEEIQNFIKNSDNYNLIQTKTNIKLQDKGSYGKLTYGGYTMEPAGPDCITSNLKRRLPEGHYKGIYHYSEARYKCNTMNLYSDMLSYKRNILVHAGGQNIAFTTGCILVSTDSYETGNIYNSKKLNGDKDYNTSTMKILKRLDNLYKALYDHNIEKKLEFNDDISSCISLVIRNQINRG